jgi:hypothetical protein
MNILILVSNDLEQKISDTITLALSLSVFFAQIYRPTFDSFMMGMTVISPSCTVRENVSHLFILLHLSISHSLRHKCFY